MSVKDKKSGTNIVDAQDMNRALVITLLRQRRLCSRVQLAKATGLKKATITNIISDMMSWGLVRETGHMVGDMGRRAVGIELNADRFKVIGIRLARRFFEVALIDILGNINSRVKKEFVVGESPENILKNIKNTVCDFLCQRDNYRILGVGMGEPGPILLHKGRVAYNLTQLPGWENISVIEEFSNAFGVPFYLDHDANVGGLAEWQYGKFARESGVMVYIAAGDGIGSGVVINGHVQRGAQGFFGEIGHTSIDYRGDKCGCSNRGCLDQYASGVALMQKVRQRLPAYRDSLLQKAPKCNVADVIRAMQEGDLLATECLKEVFTFLGIGMVNVINAYDPDIIVLGDELSTAGALMLNTVRQVVDDHVLPEISRNVRIELSSLRIDSVLLGAGAFALDQLTANPTAVFAPGIEQNY